MNKVKNRVFREDIADMETCELYFEKGIVIISSKSWQVAAICVVQCHCPVAGCLCAVWLHLQKLGINNLAVSNSQEFLFSNVFPLESLKMLIVRIASVKQKKKEHTAWISKRGKAHYLEVQLC